MEKINLPEDCGVPPNRSVLLANQSATFAHGSVDLSKHSAVVTNGYVVPANHPVEPAHDAVVAANRRDQAAAASVAGAVRFVRCFHRLEENIGRSGGGV